VHAAQLFLICQPPLPPPISERDLNLLRSAQQTAKHNNNALHHKLTPQQCGWCGAINDNSPTSAAAAAAPRRPPGAAARLLRLLRGPLRWLIVGFVISLIGVVSVVGVCVVLPRAFPSPAAYALNAGFALALLAITVRVLRRGWWVAL